MNLLETIPTPDREGASRFGWHFLSVWKACPTKWYNSFLRPLAGGLGAELKTTGQALVTGSGLHAGMQTYLSSAWDPLTRSDTGNYDLNTAVDSITEHIEGRKEEFEYSEDYDESLRVASSLMTHYHGWYGHGGLHTDYPLVQVAGDPHGPLVERTFEIDLGYNNYIFTSRLDAVVWSHSYLYSLEHKTCDVRGVDRLKARSEKDGQITGQIFALRSAYPDANIQGVLLNILVKGRGQKSKIQPFQRHTYERNDLELDKFKRDAIRTLQDIDQHVEAYRTLVSRGMDHTEAALQVFDANPPAEQCVGNFRCPYLRPCCSIGSQDRLFDTLYRPRSVDRTNPLVLSFGEKEQTT